MGIFRQFPYTNFHEFNLDWLLRHVKELEEQWADFEVDWSKDVVEQVNKWLEEHPEATTTVQDGAITTEKLHDGAVTFDKVSMQLMNAIYEDLRTYKINDDLTLQKKFLKKSSYDRNFIARRQRTDIVADNSWGLQSAEYIDSLNHIILGFTKGDESGVCILVEITKDFSEVIQTSQGLSLGHCNDLAYNPKNNRLYVATMTTGVYARSIVEIDVDTLTITNVYNVDRPIYQLSYDRDNEVFYAGSTENIIYDTEFNEIHTSSFDAVDTIIGTTTTGQGSTVFNGNYILLKETDEHAYFITHNYNTGIVEQIHRYKNMMAGDEAEALYYIPNDGLYMVSGQNYISLYKYDVKFDSSDDEMFDVFDAGKPIPSGADINNYLQAGKYYALDGNVTSSLINTPTLLGSRGMTLYVLTQSFNWLMQVIVGSGNLGNHGFYRMKQAVGNWTPWKPLQAETLLLNSSPVSVGGTVQIPAEILQNYNEITLTFYRGRYFGTVTVPTRLITNDDARNGSCALTDDGKYWKFGISTAGVITLNAMSTGLSEPYVMAMYR